MYTSDDRQTTCITCLTGSNRSSPNLFNVTSIREGLLDLNFAFPSKIDKTETSKVAKSYPLTLANLYDLHPERVSLTPCAISHSLRARSSPNPPTEAIPYHASLFHTDLVASENLRRGPGERVYRGLPCRTSTSRGRWADVASAADAPRN